MKQFKYISLASLSTLMLLTGCYDLDKYPNDQLSSGTFWTSQDDADMAMAAVYAEMQENDVMGCYFGLDCLGSVGWGSGTYGYNSVAKGTYTSSTSIVYNKWTGLYEGIARANIVLQNVDKCDMSDELKAQYKGEAKFMRAFYYFQLLDIYGGVPIYDESVVVSQSFSEMLLPRNTADEVRQFIYSDLDAAIAVLPNEGEWSSSNHGRATKTAAQALKGKTYLYAKDYANAAKMFEAVVNSGLHKLNDSYAELFKPYGYGVGDCDESSELIFSIQNIGGVGLDYGMPMDFYMGTRSSYGSCWNSVMPATDFVDTYEWKDGRAFDWDEVFPGYNESNDVKKAVFESTLTSDGSAVATYPAEKDKLLAMYEQRDPRMAATVILPYTEYLGWVSNAEKTCEFVLASGTKEGNGFIRLDNAWYSYVFRKFVAEGNFNGLINNRADTPINFPIIRYADVLLMLAECYNEQGEPLKAVPYINQVRARVGMPGLNSGEANLVATTQEQVRKRIVLERGWEFAGEGLSFSDYKRWGRLEELNREMKDIVGATKYSRVVQSRDYLWPIRQSELDKNPNLEQNPGW